MGSPPQCYRDCKAEEQSTGSWMRPGPMVAALPEHRHLCPSSPPASVPSFGPPSHWRAAWDRISAYTGDSKMLLVPHRLRGCGCHTEASATCCGHSGHASLHPSSLQPRSLTLSLRMFPQRKRPKALLCKKKPRKEWKCLPRNPQHLRTSSQPSQNRQTGQCCWSQPLAPRVPPGQPLS